MFTGREMDYIHIKSSTSMEIYKDSDSIHSHYFLSSLPFIILTFPNHYPTPFHVIFLLTPVFDPHSQPFHFPLFHLFLLLSLNKSPSPQPLSHTSLPFPFPLTLQSLRPSFYSYLHRANLSRLVPQYQSVIPAISTRINVASHLISLREDQGARE